MDRKAIVKSDKTVNGNPSVFNHTMRTHIWSYIYSSFLNISKDNKSSKYTWIFQQVCKKINSTLNLVILRSTTQYYIFLLLIYTYNFNFNIFVQNKSLLAIHLLLKILFRSVIGIIFSVFLYCLGVKQSVIFILSSTNVGILIIIPLLDSM